MMKRISGRAIIFIDNEILLMHRIKQNDEYYAFAGGGLEENENIEQCIVREIKEEFGINISCKKKIYEYESLNTKQYFYLAEYISGDFGSGDGEEYQDYNIKYGKFIPEKININNIKDIDLRPSFIKDKLLHDINEYGIELSNNPWSGVNKDDKY